MGEQKAGFTSFMQDDDGDGNQDYDNDSQDHEKDIRESFQIIDADKDGKITKEELINAASMLGINLTDAEADDMIVAADLDEDGQINFEEYSKVMNEEIIDIERERMIAAFQTLDKNKDGFLTFNEL